MPVPSADAIPGGAAIDTHVHVEQDGHGHLSLDDELMDASQKYFRSGANRTPTVADIADQYRARSMAAVVFTVDATTATGHQALSSEEIATAAQDHADVIIPFGTVDPLQAEASVARARSLATDHGAGLQVPPSLQGFAPNHRAFYPVAGRRRARRTRHLPHRPDRHRRGPARRSWDQAALLRPDADR
jgi:uncharacterized protein